MHSIDLPNPPEIENLKVLALERTEKRIESGIETRIWVGTMLGLFELRDGPDGLALIRTLGPRDGLPSSYISSLRADRDGDIWVGTDAGLALVHVPD